MQRVTYTCNNNHLHDLFLRDKNYFRFRYSRYLTIYRSPTKHNNVTPYKVSKMPLLTFSQKLFYFNLPIRALLYHQTSFLHWYKVPNSDQLLLNLGAAIPDAALASSLTPCQTKNFLLNLLQNFMSLVLDCTTLTKLMSLTCRIHVWPIGVHNYKSW